jgi:hypothetical protein
MLSIDKHQPMLSPRKINHKLHKLISFVLMAHKTPPLIIIADCVFISFALDTRHFGQHEKVKDINKRIALIKIQSITHSSVHLLRIFFFVFPLQMRFKVIRVHNAIKSCVLFLASKPPPPSPPSPFRIIHHFDK